MENIQENTTFVAININCCIMVTELNPAVDPTQFVVMVVDDVAANILLMQVMLTGEKYNVVTATNGMEALQKVEEVCPDLILLDVMMPNMNGYEVCRRLKQNPETAHIPIVFLTALHSPQDVVNGFQAGAADYISKPFNKEELIIRVNHQLSLVAARRVITEQNKELERHILGRDKLYSVIAHDLRSPLASLNMMLEMLVSRLPSEQIGEESSEMLKMAKTSSCKLIGLLDNLQKWTKSQTGKWQVRPDVFVVNDTIREVCNLYHMLAERKGMSFEFEDTERLLVYADVDMVQTVLRNLLTNAIKFSYPNSVIRIRVERSDNEAVLSVIDQGKGISSEDQKKLFDVETHFSKSGTQNEEGSGLGLLLCQDFAVKNGGRLWLESEVEKGSTFSFSVPLQL